ncbi:alpha/beta hydrolase fold domain-containing protein [Nevskia sp.]|uniref:alpha/beta hydrolase fold domain-containing protein n=1 Tax=Nevskia sp. TaxID=1929292 RepID=UPI003F715396
MMLRLLSAALLPVAVLTSSCARHLGKPDGAAPPRLKLDWTVQRDLRFTPVDWPKPLLADLYTPAGDAPPGGWPAVVMIHGGGWSSGDREQVEGIARRVARRGYVTLNITYRLAPESIFPAQVVDVQQAVRWLRGHAADYRVDPARIGAWGYSAGAHLAAMLGGLSPGDRLYQPGAEVKAVVAGGIPSDLRKFHGGTIVPKFLGERWSENSRAFRESSPAAYVTPGDPPVFLYHGGWDQLVPFDQASDYQLALDAAGVPNELYELRGLGHITAFLMDGEAVQRGLDFLDRHLR